MADLRAQLLQRIHDDLDDDLARSVYADHLLEYEAADAWHGELIRLQLDHGDPERIRAIIHERKTRALGPLVRLFDEVIWERGFPARARTRFWTDEHVGRLVESKHLPTLRSIEIGFARVEIVPLLLAAPPSVTERITELVIGDGAQLSAIAPLLASSQFPALRKLALRREARLMPSYPNTDVLDALLTSTLASTASRIAMWSPQHEHDQRLDLVPPTVQQLDVFELDYSDYTEVPYNYVRVDGVLALTTDRVTRLASQMWCFNQVNVAHLTAQWPREEVEELERVLRRDGFDALAEIAREVIDYPIDEPDDNDDDDD